MANGTTGPTVPQVSAAVPMTGLSPDPTAASPANVGTRASSGGSHHTLFLPSEDEPIRGDVLGPEGLEAHARLLAEHAQGDPVTSSHRHELPLLRRFHENARSLVRSHRLVSHAFRRRETFGADAEWLLDNFHIVEEALREIRTDLPRGYYRLLPKLLTGPHKGSPRVYALAQELIAHTDSCLDEGNITRFVESYQSVMPLTIGELWAIPIMLRLGLIENLRRLAEGILRSREDRLLARAVLPRLLARHQKGTPFSPDQAVASELGQIPGRRDRFVAQLWEGVRELGGDSVPVVEWLERQLGGQNPPAGGQHALAELLRRDRQRQAADQVSVGNCVTSLRLLSALDWSTFFEKTSAVEAILRADPAGVYTAQDFQTRDRYRQAVEKLSRGSTFQELDVARLAVALAGRDLLEPGKIPSPQEPGDRFAAERPAGPASNHVGYYLIDDGRRELEAAVRYRPGPGEFVKRTMLSRPNAVYFGGVIGLTVLLLAALATIGVGAQIAAGGGSAWLIVLLVAAAALPASELAVGVVNFAVPFLLPPRVLPKFGFKTGIATDCPTFVVIPGMLTRPGSAAALLERLEIHWLSNQDPQLRFALLTDFSDAATETRPEDEGYLKAALDGVRALNEKYTRGGPDRFFVCHRTRRWNPGQNCWMGWERKRGKLCEFNRLLRGATDTSYTTVSGDLSRLPRTRFVITLDADTQLPHEAAQRLVATLVHPLNQPHFDPAAGRVMRGYGILQPRVSPTLTGSRKSLFTSIFANSAGIDPYSTAVSDVYMDLFGSGTFTGKGIYDVDAFEAAVGHTFPDNRILSHDLIEGNYARCGLVTDIELLDDFPARYHVYARREHRWARGDWQIISWLFGSVPAPAGGDRTSDTTASQTARRRNPLGLLERWKVFDNLRRSLVPPALVILLVLGWVLLPGPAWVWTGLAAGVLALPVLLFLVATGIGCVRVGPRRMPWGELKDRFLATCAQTVLIAVLLAEQARLMVDAAVRTLYRLAVTRKHLLEWETAAAAEARLGDGFKHFALTMWPAPALSLAVAALTAVVRPESLPVAAPVLLGWFLSPAVACWVSRSLKPAETGLTGAERRRLHRLARLTWGFFETFVTAKDHWLPPDNYQEDPKGEVANRTSPTNIGLYLVSAVAANRFGYIGFPGLLRRVEQTLETVGRLDKSHGHLYNWYDTQTLQLLPPAYLSTVDSGNLLGCLITLKQGLLAGTREPFVGGAVRQGLADTLELIAEEVAVLTPPDGLPDDLVKEVTATVEVIRNLVAETPDGLPAWYAWLGRVKQAGDDLSTQVLKLSEAIREEPEPLQQWTQQFAALAAEHHDEVTAGAPWLRLTATIPEPLRAAAPDSDLGKRWVRLAAVLTGSPSLAAIETGTKTLAAELTAVAAEVPAVKSWALEVIAAAQGSVAPDLCRRAAAAADTAQRLADAMDFRMLYNQTRHLFSIGYNLASNHLDNSHYDLLASEAALTSFLAIARGDVPKKHWFQLGRPVTKTAGSIALISWGGTMFEYLLPRLFLRSFGGTLLVESQRAAVGRQIEYGRQSRVPWGISESAYSAVDSSLNYQYQAFGVPGLGLKRGLGRDLVIAPYATVLATMVAPHEAIANFDRLQAEGGEGEYGFYEALDYTRDRQKRPARAAGGGRAVVVKCFMAHHQGMSFLALANCLMDNPVQRWFHAEPMVRASELLLQERVPQEAERLEPNAEEGMAPAGTQEPPHQMSRRLTTPHTAHPRTNLLSGGAYSVALTNAGGSRSRSNGLDVTRWREDATADHWGQFCYLHDLRSGSVWSATYQPVGREPEEYEVTYSTDKAEYRRVDGGIETHLEITVSPEYRAEIRRLTVINHNSRPQDIEITSYAEVALAAHPADLAHPAFGKLFLETEYVPADQAVLCRRRPRSPEEKPVWAVHVLAVAGPMVGAIQYETDRARFLGRGRPPAAPAALDPGAVLSGTVGAVLDPVFSLRCVLRVAPQASVSLAFTTGVADSREEAVSLADHYHDMHGVIRAFELAWAHNQVELRHLHVDPRDAHLYQRLAAHVLFAGPALRAPATVLAANSQGKHGLWRHGISGDYPIVLVRIAETEELPLVRQLLAAHAYWRLKGLDADLVILNDHQTGYFEDLHDQLQALVRGSDSRNLLDKPGGVFLRKSPHMSHDDQILFQAMARCVLAGTRGPLAAQLDRLERAASSRTVNVGSPAVSISPARALQPRVNEDLTGLRFFNGFGGFAADGREYVITVPGSRQTGRTFPPAPWVNVIANPVAGFYVSEAGAGPTWVGNSQTNRLTPWANDPVSDQPGEVVYLRDDVSGEVWTATPAFASMHGPGRSPAYRVRHGQGYSVFEHTAQGIASELSMFVPVGDPVKVVRLKVRNTTRRARRVSAVFYAEWVLGTVREVTAMHVRTEVDAGPGGRGTIIARNPTNPDYGSKIAFADCGPAAPEKSRQRTFTTDRAEFIGRNGSVANPAALAKGDLSGVSGPGLDPCVALHVTLDLKADEARDLVFVLGQAGTVDEVRHLAGTYTDPGKADAAFAEMRQHWDRILTTVHIRTPDEALDLVINRWMLYQTLSCRVWGRSALYQSGGAFGFRDQLQDSMALVYAAPAEARAHLLRAAGRQFLEGDVQHWWHPPTGAGVRTRFSDDLLWLPFVALNYVRVTGDHGVLDEPAGFLTQPLLRPEQEEDYRVPEVAPETGTLYEHCVRAIDQGSKFGDHGLPLMGTGDWNDGMNRVGWHGKGESVWNAWFLLVILRQFADLAETRGDASRADLYRRRHDQLRKAVEDTAWDGAWYRRAYFDDGTPLGSAQNDECQIDSLAQTWAVLSGDADPERAARGVKAVEEKLVRMKDGLILLFTPPFDRGGLQPGYIKGYVPGIRENGGQYTHAATWVVQAAARSGQGKVAGDLLRLLNPVTHTRTPAEVERYRVEPYVIAADVYGEPPHTGRGGWTWYTGSASWFYRVAVEDVLGFRVAGDTLRVSPCVPPGWDRFEIVYRHRSATYRVTVTNPSRVERGVKEVVCDGHPVPDGHIRLADDGKEHAVGVVMG